MNLRQRLAYTCQAESKAYGYTLSIWGTGALLIARFGTPTPRSVFSFIGGGLLGFALLTALAFGTPLSNTEVDTDSEFLVATTVHVIATPGNLLLSYGLVSLLGGVDIAAWLVFGLVGLQATVMYNVFTLLEDSLIYLVDEVADARS